LAKLTISLKDINERTLSRITKVEEVIQRDCSMKSISIRQMDEAITTRVELVGVLSLVITNMIRNTASPKGTIGSNKFGQYTDVSM
jgi:hypothetical protein